VLTETTAARKRRFKRYGILGSVVLRSHISAPQLPATLYDLSISGCLLWVDARNVISDTEFIEVVLRFESLTFRTMARVAYTAEEGQLFGVEFLRLNVGASNDLADFLTGLECLSLKSD
jgi:hypothetical protein